MSSQPTSLEQPRRRLTERQAAVVARLTAAALRELRSKGYEGLTVRNVAARAGVAPATAYTYFASKDHLIAELFWSRLRALREPRVNGQRAPVVRVRAAFREVTSFLAAEPALSAATTTALLAADPDVKHLRDRIGAEIRWRLAAALGEGHDPDVLDALELAVGGAMLQAGMGHLSYEELPDRIAGVAALLMRGR
jgi:AcrR family transcriptional regulator